MNPDNTGGKEGHLVDLASLLGGGGLGTNGITVREHPSGGWEMHASRNLTADEMMGGEAGLWQTQLWLRSVPTGWVVGRPHGGS